MKQIRKERIFFTIASLILFVITMQQFVIYGIDVRNIMLFMFWAITILDKWFIYSFSKIIDKYEKLCNRSIKDTKFVCDAMAKEIDRLTAKLKRQGAKNEKIH